jgi:hypothetical protein
MVPELTLPILLVKLNFTKDNTLLTVMKKETSNAGLRWVSLKIPVPHIRETCSF